MAFGHYFIHTQGLGKWSKGYVCPEYAYQPSF